jgi:hypothetical protein
MVIEETFNLLSVRAKTGVRISGQNFMKVTRKISGCRVH